MLGFLLMGALYALAYYLGWYWFGAIVAAWVALSQLNGLIRAWRSPEWYIAELLSAGIELPKPSWQLHTGSELRKEMAGELRALTLMKSPMIAIAIGASAWMVSLAIA